MTEDQETYVERIMKLLAKAESTTPEEADALTAKAAQLMARHAIDEAMLAARKGHVTDEIVEHRIKLKSSYLRADMALGFAVGAGFGFKLLQNKRSSGEGVVIWIGWKSEIPRAETLFTSLMLQRVRAAAAFMRTWNLANDWARAFDKYKTRRDFMVGFADETEHRLLKARQDARQAAQADYAQDDAEAEKTGAPSMALVLRTKDEQVKDWYDKRYGKLKSARASRMASGGAGAYSAGRSAAACADHGGTGVGGGRGELGR